MTELQESGKAILVSLERLLDAADLVWSQRASSIYDFQAYLGVTSNRALELARSLDLTDLAALENATLQATPSLEQLIHVWEKGDEDGMSNILSNYIAYSACIRYLRTFKSVPLIKGAPAWLTHYGNWRHGRAERLRIIEEAKTILQDQGLNATCNWADFKGMLVEKGEDSFQRNKLWEFHLLGTNGESERTRRYFFQWLTMSKFGINPAAFDQMGLWAHTLSKAYKTTDMLYWGADNPRMGDFQEAVKLAFESIGRSGEFLHVGRICDWVCRSLYVAPKAFEAMMLDLIEQDPKRISISGAVGLEKRGLGAVFYSLKPRSEGPPWFERRWLADGLRTPQGNIKFIRLEI